jgi:hypothetical protein
MLIRSFLMFAVLLGSVTAGETNPVFETLIEKGIDLPKGPDLKLPKPSLPDGLDAAAQRKVLEGIAGERPVESLLRKGVSAPVVFASGDVEASADAGGSGKFVNFWFVVYGDLKKVADEGFWSAKKKEGAAEDAPNPNDAQFSGKLLESAELRERGIDPIVSANVVENYGSFEVQLFNRVRVRGVTRAVQTQTPESVTYAAILDPRFANDAKYPDQWQSVGRDDAGKLQYGPWTPYQGLAAYAKATELKEPRGAILVEYHMIFDEPKGWFRGANVIRSKLPIIVQDNVKKLRRKLAENQTGS